MPLQAPSNTLQGLSTPVLAQKLPNHAQQRSPYLRPSSSNASTGPIASESPILAPSTAASRDTANISSVASLESYQAQIQIARSLQLRIADLEQRLKSPTITSTEREALLYNLKGSKHMQETVVAQIIALRQANGVP